MYKNWSDAIVSLTAGSILCLQNVLHAAAADECIVHCTPGACYAWWQIPQTAVPLSVQEVELVADNLNKCWRKRDYAEGGT